MAGNKPFLKPTHIVLLGFLVLLFFSVNQYSDIIHTLSDYSGEEQLTGIMAGKLRIHMVLNIAAITIIGVFVAYAAGQAAERS